MAGRKQQQWRVGDVFAIPIRDGRFVIGQVIGQEPNLMRSVTVALFDEPHDSIEEAHQGPACIPSNLFAVLFVTVNHLDSGDWSIIDHRPVAIDARFNPYEYTRNQGFVGAKVIGSGIVNEFVNAFYGLTPWDDWKDPHYLDSLLVSEGVKPVGRLVYKHQSRE